MARKNQRKSYDVDQVRSAAQGRWGDLDESKVFIFGVSSKGLILPAIVDAKHAHLVKPYMWCLSGNEYIQRNGGRKEDGRSRVIRLHRLIHSVECRRIGVKCIVDHMNCDKLDNRTANLRCSNKQENGWNRGPNKNNRSGFKGVSLTRTGRWMALIKAADERRYLGLFDSPEEAAEAYRQAAEELHGQFARME